MRYTLDFWRDDMGTFKQPGCTGAKDALWHINKAREHDGLAPLTMDDMSDALNFPSNAMKATLTPEPERPAIEHNFKPMQFIDFVDSDDRATHFNVHGGNPKDEHYLNVRGGLSHNARIRPKTKADAQRLIDWLKVEFGI
jgi:hypothetical protein